MSFADSIQGRLEGALKRWDTEDELSEEEIETLAARWATDFEGYVTTRFSKERQATLRGEDGE